MYGPWTCYVEYGRWPCRCFTSSPNYNSTRAHVYRQVSKLAIADKLSPLMQTCSSGVKYNYNSNSNLLIVGLLTESEVKAVNNTLKSEVISNRGILNAIGWKQGPTIIEEDNQACVYASEAKHMTRNLRHLDLAQLWLKEKVADETCIHREGRLKREQL